MDLKWLEDFLILAETRSFSRAGELRHVTQSAFSRRIQALEQWLGEPLVDRGSFPVTLTARGRQFRETAEEVVRLLEASRSTSPGRPAQPVITFAALHSLTITFFPQWFARLAPAIGPATTRVLPENFLICVQTLIEGGYDFMLTFHHPGVPIPLDPERFRHLTVGHDVLVPVAVPGIERLARDGRLPLLQYSRGSFLGLLTARAQGEAGAPQTYLAHTNENSMAEALKFMALAGHGLAWLPRALVAGELASGALEVLGPEMPMGIRLYRSAERKRAVLETVWAAAAAAAAEDGNEDGRGG